MTNNIHFHNLIKEVQRQEPEEICMQFFQQESTLMAQEEILHLEISEKLFNKTNTVNPIEMENLRPMNQD